MSYMKPTASSEVKAKPRAEQTSAAITSGLEYNTKEPEKHASSRAKPNKMQMSELGAVLPGTGNVEGNHEAAHQSAMAVPSRTQVSSDNIIPGTGNVTKEEKVDRTIAASGGKNATSTNEEPLERNLARSNRNAQSDKTSDGGTGIARNPKAQANSHEEAALTSGIKASGKSNLNSSGEASLTGENISRNPKMQANSTDHQEFKSSGLAVSPSKNAQSSTEASLTGENITRVGRNAQSSTETDGGSGISRSARNNQSHNVLDSNSLPEAKEAKRLGTVAAASGAGSKGTNPMIQGGHNTQNTEQPAKAPISVRVDRNASTPLW